MLSMPAYMENSGVLSTKLVCFYKREDGSTLPSTQATMLLLDPEFGNMKAVSNQNLCTNDHELNHLLHTFTLYHINTAKRISATK